MRICALVIAVSLVLAACGPDEDVVDDGAEATAASSVDDTPAPSTTAGAVASTTTIIETTAATGGSDTGYEAVEAALAEAQDLWAGTTNRNWGYLLEVDCDCAEAGSSWVRRWADLDPSQGIRELDGLYARIAAAIESQPDSSRSSSR